MRSRTLRPSFPTDLAATLGPLQHGRGDPCVRIDATGFWQATRAATEPALLHLSVGSGVVEADAWGPGADVALDRVPELIGCSDSTADGFVAGHPVVADLARRHPGFRLGRSGSVMEFLIPTILEQKVAGKEAWRSYRELVHAFSEPAPGPSGLMLPPDPAVLAAVPYFDYHSFGIERKRADSIRAACARAPRMEEARSMDHADAERRLQAIPGIGPWTSATVCLVALGHPDAVVVGDYHLPDVVAWALAGEARADDARMLELLAPFAGQRGRVTRLLELGVTPPRFGPRNRLRSIASI